MRGCRRNFNTSRDNMHRAHDPSAILRRAFVLGSAYRQQGGRAAMNLDFSVYTWVHVIISLIGILTGFVVMKGMLASQRLNDWTAVFLATTALTSLTGFGFPFEKILPSHIFGVISLAVLLLAIVARYAFGLEGRWRAGYVV